MPFNPTSKHLVPAAVHSIHRFALFAVLLLLTSSVALGDETETETESGDGATAADAPVGASDEGELAMGTFRKPDGWEISLFAAEPELANPVAMYIDHLGRVFVCESFRQDRGVTDNRKHDSEWLLADLSAQSVQDRIDYHRRLLGTEAAEYTAHDDRIRVLEDTDGDGVADKTTIFADGFNNIEDGTGAGVLARGGEVYFTCIPKLWKLDDTNGDMVADKRVALHDGYGVRVAFRGHDSHGLIIGPDGRLYFSIGDRGYNIDTPEGKLKDPESGAVFRCELDGSNLEVFATGLRNPQELAFDDYGYLFTGDNNSDSGDKARWVNVMQGGDSGWRMMYQYLPDRGPFNREKIWHPFHSETPAYIVPPIENISDGPSGLTCYPGTGLTGDYANCFFLADFRGGPVNSGIRLIRTQPKGAFWEVERSEQPIWSILATDIDFGPDGAIWICDWVNGWVGEGKGRVYRFFDPQAQEQAVVKEVKELLSAGFKDVDTNRLRELLEHPDRRIRLESQWELASRGDLAPFRAVLERGDVGTIPRLHAIWGIGHAARLDNELAAETQQLIGDALSDDDLDVRRCALIVAGDLGLSGLSGRVSAAIADPEPRVAFAACLAAAELSLPVVNEAAKLLSDNDNSDPGLRHAGIMALVGSGAEQVLSLASHNSSAVRLGAVVALRKLNDGRVSEFLADGDSAVVLEAARAVHDVVAMHETGLGKLATVELSADSSPALIHRVLNANYRIGDAAAAGRIGAFAVQSDADAAMRLEAVQMLADWANPDPLCRVMNRYLPLGDRAANIAADVLTERASVLLSSVTPVDIRVATIDAVAFNGVTSAAPELEAIIKNEDDESTVRAKALSGIAQLSPSTATSLVKLMSDDPELELRLSALNLLVDLQAGKSDTTEAVEALAKAVTSDFSRERQLAWDKLATLKGQKVDQLLVEGAESYLNEKLPADVWLNYLEAAKGRLDQTLQSKLDGFGEKLAMTDPLAAYRDCLSGGDAEAGKVLFETKTELSCVRCHKISGQGGEVGPELTKIAADKDRSYLLEAIVLPNKTIAKNYETTMLLLESGEVVSGILRSETEDEIEVLNADGKTITVDPYEIVGRKKGDSSMPADLIKMMSRRELRDLVAYLSTLK
ncbi:MAG TPA: glucose dehydrogenase [Planctomycetaceae bacterium]|nr:glucose dehydrogenase [Planctomycetaceae bacterium]